MTIDNIVTIKKECGLSNRIKSILSALRSYDKVNTIVEADSYIFPDITLVDELINPFIDWRLHVFPEEEQYIEKYKTIDFLYNDTPEYFVKKYLNILDKIKINPEILEYVNDFLDDWNDVIGVHIRSWWSSGMPRYAWHDNELYENEIDKFDSNKKIFLCSDNNDVIRHFKKKYGERIIVHDQVMHERKCDVFGFHHDDVQLVTDGFIDCLLLSKCDTIIGTWGSTFTEVAWWLSKCKANVIIPKSPNITQKDEEDFFTLK